MSRDLVGRGRELARKGFIFQCVIASLLVLFGLFYTGYQLAISLACGAIISILPTRLFAGFAFRYAGARQNNLVARSFSQGAKAKLALTIILFVVAFAGLKASPLPVFIAFAITTTSYWLVMFRDGTQERK